MKSLWIALIIVLVACQGGMARSNEPNDPNYPDDPNELIRVKWDAVISVLRMKDLDQDTREKKINKIVSPIFDFPLMAKLALGRENWPKLTAAQQKKFTELFVGRIKTSYREKIALYTDKKVESNPAVRKKQIIHVPAELISKDKKIQVLHKL